MRCYNVASFSKRGTTWQYRINHIVDGRRKQISKGGFKTKKECQVAANEIENELSKGKRVIVREKSFAEYFNEWIELYKSTRHIMTYERYKNSSHRVEEYFKDKPIQKINRGEYQRFLNEYGIGRAKQTVRKLHSHVRACVVDAVEEGYISIDFTRKIEFNATKETKRSEDKHLDYEESVKLYNYLLANLEGKTYLSIHLLLLALVSGMRFGELVGLTTDCFNFKNNEIKIYRSWDYKRGTGFAGLKNKQSERTIGIDPDVMNVFKKFLLQLPPNKYNTVFYQQNSVGTITNEGVTKLLKRILNSLEVKVITTHGLRHTHASVLLFKGSNVYSVSKRLGHENIQTTLNTYTHVLKEMEERDEKIAISIYK